MENRMDMEKIDTALTSLINGVKNKLAEDNNLCACYESSLTLWRLCDKVDIPYIGFNINEVGLNNFIHHYGICSVEGVCALIDLTYNQFIDNKYPLYFDKDRILVNSPINYLREENKYNLLTKGYMILTEENYIDYITSFINSYKSVKNIDDSIIYDKAYKLLEDFNIKFVEKEYLNNKKITY